MSRKNLLKLTIDDFPGSSRSHYKNRNIQVTLTMPAKIRDDQDPFLDRSHKMVLNVLLATGFVLDGLRLSLTPAFLMFTLSAGRQASKNVYCRQRRTGRRMYELYKRL